jgi:hypothetical protein
VTDRIGATGTGLRAITATRNLRDAFDSTYVDDKDRSVHADLGERLVMKANGRDMDVMKLIGSGSVSATVDDAKINSLSILQIDNFFGATMGRLLMTSIFGQIAPK